MDMDLCEGHLKWQLLVKILGSSRTLLRIFLAYQNLIKIDVFLLVIAFICCLNHIYVSHMIWDSSQGPTFIL